MSNIFIHNTLTGKKEEFVPLNPPEVKMYVCGITPYDMMHLGHGRCYVVFDVIRRYLEYRGYKVHYIQNFTDIDDKIINRSNELGISPQELSEKYIKEYFEYSSKLNIKRANNYPRVTENISQIINVIKTLIDKGFAYVSGGDVYFSVKKFSEYGKLSKRKIEELIAGIRVQPEENKKDQLDFALWKQAKEGEPSWESPWGKGRPGWHIECSVMSLDKAGVQTLDIHGGGQDLIFPHHENEIAQAEAFTGSQFVRYWIHNGFVTINKEKMSKSLGNFFSLKDIFEKYKPTVVRYMLISQHYRQPLDFSDSKLEQAKSSLNRIENVMVKSSLLDNISPEGKKSVDEFVQKFVASMNDDFNTSEALACVHSIVNILNKTNTKYAYERLKELCDVLGLEISGKTEIPVEIRKLAEERENARKIRNWPRADELREEIELRGFKIEDTPHGPRIHKK